MTPHTALSPLTVAELSRRLELARLPTESEVELLRRLEAAADRTEDLERAIEDAIDRVDDEDLVRDLRFALMYGGEQ